MNKESNLGKDFTDLCNKNSRRNVLLQISGNDLIYNGNDVKINIELVCEVTHLMRKHNIQDRISYNANLLNPIEINLSEYVIANTKQGPVKNWGDERGFLNNILRPTRNLCVFAYFDNGFESKNTDFDSYKLGENLIIIDIIIDIII